MLKYILSSFQIFVFLLTLVFAGIGTWGTLSIRQHFDPTLLLPADSYLRQWIVLKGAHFPQVHAYYELEVDF